MYRIVERLGKIVDRLINRASKINPIITINTQLTMEMPLFIAFVFPGTERILCRRPVIPLPHNPPEISHSGLRYVSHTDPSVNGMPENQNRGILRASLGRKMNQLPQLEPAKPRSVNPAMPMDS